MTVRPRYQRAFLAWHERHAATLPVQIVRGKRTDASLEFRFAGWGDALQCWIRREGLTIGAFEKEDCWDLIFDPDVDPERVAGGYVCSLCEKDARQVFPTREALWEDHLFEPLRVWMVEKLAPANHLAFHGTRNSMTWARLETSLDRSGDSGTLFASFAPFRPDASGGLAGGYTRHRNEADDE